MSRRKANRARGYEKRHQQLPATPDWFTCSCGKRGFTNRADAARERRGHRERTNLGVYRCPTSATPPRWHLGHKPSALIRGEISRDEIGSRRPIRHTDHDDLTADHEIADRFTREDHR